MKFIITIALLLFSSLSFCQWRKTTTTQMWSADIFTCHDTTCKIKGFAKAILSLYYPAPGEPFDKTAPQQAHWDWDGAHAYNGALSPIPLNTIIMVRLTNPKTKKITNQ
jgi:hypothetical protein